MNSKYFVIEEFRCHSGVAYPAHWEVTRLEKLIGMLDVIREAWQGPITVISGYRAPAYNDALVKASAARNGGVSGVATHSQHIEGRAADVRPGYPTAERVTRLYDLIRDLNVQGKLPELGGLGKYPGWVHVDVRAKVNGHLATWGGVGMGESV